MGTAPTLRPRRRAAMVRRAWPQGKRARLELASCSLSLSAKMAFIGAWPSGKATGFGPVIPGSNPGAPATQSRIFWLSPDPHRTDPKKPGNAPPDGYAAEGREARDAVSGQDGAISRRLSLLGIFGGHTRA